MFDTTYDIDLSATSVVNDCINFQTDLGRLYDVASSQTYTVHSIRNSRAMLQLWGQITVHPVQTRVSWFVNERGELDEQTDGRTHLQVGRAVVEQLQHVPDVLRVLDDEVQLHVELAADELQAEERTIRNYSAKIRETN